jgi:hypothetical protein
LIIFVRAVVFFAVIVDVVVAVPAVPLWCLLIVDIVVVRFIVVVQFQLLDIFDLGHFFVFSRRQIPFFPTILVPESSRPPSLIIFVRAVVFLLLSSLMSSSSLLLLLYLYGVCLIVDIVVAFVVVLFIVVVQFQLLDIFDLGHFFVFSRRQIPFFPINSCAGIVATTIIDHLC